MQIVADPGGKLPAVAPGHGAQIQLGVDACRCTRAGPVAHRTAGGRGFDHRGRHGELAHTLPGEKTEITVRSKGAHQHSPCADGASPRNEKFVIAAKRTAPPPRPSVHRRLIGRGGSLAEGSAGPPPVAGAPPPTCWCSPRGAATSTVRPRPLW